jgi:hypothetical protein
MANQPQEALLAPQTLKETQVRKAKRAEIKAITLKRPMRSKT